MILPDHMPHLERLRALGAYRSPMLMLGNQECHVGTSAQEFFDVESYTTLDPDGGDLRRDLSSDLSDLFGRFACVFNLGTLEHVWDVHAAYSNAARMVRPGGVFIGHAPVGGWEQHGVHVTGERFILEFFALNGFSINEHWLVSQPGTGRRRPNGRQTLWTMATKITEVECFSAPQQVFERGRALP